MVVLVTAAPSRRRSSSRPAESTRPGWFLSFSLFLLFYPFPLASSPVNPLVLFRSAITSVFVHPLHRIARLAPTSPFLPFILLVPLPFSLAFNPLSPYISHYAPSLTLSPCSSAKTSIRLSPVAPRYTDPTRASRRVPRVPRGNVDPTSLPRLAVTTTSHTSVARHVLPARDSQPVTT